MNPHYNSYNKVSHYPFFFSYGYHYYPYGQPIYRQMNTVDPTMLMNSAKEMENLMKDASLLLAKMKASKQFSYELMNAAQQSKLVKVENMIKSTGVKKVPKVSYTPDGLHLDFKASADYNNCCILILKLRWT